MPMFLRSFCWPVTPAPTQTHLVAKPETIGSIYCLHSCSPSITWCLLPWTESCPNRTPNFNFLAFPSIQVACSQVQTPSPSFVSSNDIFRMSKPGQPIDSGEDVIERAAPTARLAFRLDEYCLKVGKVFQQICIDLITL